MLCHLAKNRLFPAIAAAPLLLALGACGGGESSESAYEAPDAEQAMEDEASAADDAPRVYFVGLEDQAEIPTLINLQFAAENFIIEPVGDGTINEGAGHYHIAIDGECLEPGIVIPTADPWIHFGDGSDSIELELSPGEHHLCLQIGDGEHRTLDEPGLAQYIMVNVVNDETAE